MVNEIIEAFRKLKNQAYYNRSELHTLRAIAEYEAQSPLAVQAANVERLLQLDLDSKEWRELFGLVKTIQLPKAIALPLKNESNLVSNERVEDKYEVDRAVTFISAPVELLILNVLWVTRIGAALDSQLRECVKGNRLALNEDKRVSRGLSLFKRYHEQYREWRDKGIDTAKQLLGNGCDVAFINLDIKDYYYSVRYKQADLDVSVQKDLLSAEDRKLHDILARVHRVFNKLAPTNPELAEPLADEFVLPIGLPSSYVLGNFYLSAFDEQVERRVRPAYYARYVDDIVLVIKHASSPRQLQQGQDGDVVPLLLHEYLGRVLTGTKEKVDAKVFKLSHLPNLTIQSDKTLVLHFNKQESTSVLDRLKEDILQRSSEFRFMTDGELRHRTFEREAYELVYDGSQGKIRTLKDYRENRYGLSLNMTHRIFSALKHRESEEPAETQKILSLFRGYNALDYYRFWEKVVTLFVIQRNAKALEQLVRHICEQIGRIEVTPSAADSGINPSQLRLALLQHLANACAISIGLDPKVLTTRLRTALRACFAAINPMLFGEDNRYLVFRKQSLTRNHFIPQPGLDLCSGKMLESPLCVREFPLLQQWTKAGLKDSATILKTARSVILPRRTKFYECAIFVANVLNTFGEDNWEISYLEQAFDLFYDLNYWWVSSPEHKERIKAQLFVSKDNTVGETCVIELLATHDARNPKVKVGFANLQVNIERNRSSLRGKPCLTRDRTEELDELLKRSAKERLDLFLLPEICVPHDLSWILAQHSSRYNQTIVAGLEHVRRGSVAYNLVMTCLPVRGAMHDCIPVFRSKNHFAPNEEEEILGHGIRPKSSSQQRYHLFRWHGIYFTVFYCFELADIAHRAGFRSRIDLLICAEYNRDVRYFSNLVASAARDLHCVVAQVNSAQFGDSRLTYPRKTDVMDSLRLKGGENQTILVATVDFASLRRFQQTTTSYQSKSSLENPNSSYKVTPPSFEAELARRREDGEAIFPDAAL